MSVELSLVLVPVPLSENANGWVTGITVSIANLEGTLGSAEAWGLSGLTISGLGTSAQYLPNSPSGAGPWDILNVAPSYSGDAGSTGSTGGGYWTARPAGSNPGYIQREAQIGDGGFPIAGCTPLTPDATFGLYFFEPGYLHTCGDGRVVYTFTGPPLELTDATTISIAGRTNSGQNLSCTFGVDCQSVVAEPATFALLGTGLIGIGGLRVRFARRRRPS